MVDGEQIRKDAQLTRNRPKPGQSVAGNGGSLRIFKPCKERRLKRVSRREDATDTTRATHLGQIASAYSPGAGACRRTSSPRPIMDLRAGRSSSSNSESHQCFSSKIPQERKDTRAEERLWERVDMVENKIKQEGREELPGRRGVKEKKQVRRRGKEMKRGLKMRVKVV
ncbi:hypothetical protein RND81_12G094500 [Saponaria officinalis]|uniref:Uncharacterized protein n=1 Tax=Saponaria officinalis TaxID=3572 RepID=A0AAW1H8H3_SAPOF